MYINKFNFKEAQNCLPIMDEDYFYVDDLIGPTVKELCSKRYKVLESCSGHPCNIHLVLKKEETKSDKLRKILPNIDTPRELRVSTSVYLRIGNSKSIEKELLKSEIPEQFELSLDKQDAVIQYKFNEEDENMFYYEKAEYLVELNKKLYDWARSLPSLI